MTEEQLLKNLSVPEGRIDAVLDTDTYNEADDQFALAYMLGCGEKVSLKAVYAAPFFNEKSSSPKDGMLKSYDEIMSILELADRTELSGSVFRGAEEYLADEKTPSASDASRDLAARARLYSPERPLYVVAIAALTNIASALIAAPEIAENIVVVWLGGNAYHSGRDCREFNMEQDIAAARVLFSSGVPVVQLPCAGVVTQFAISEQEFRYWLGGKNKVCDFLVDNVMRAQRDWDGMPWSRIIWDVTAAAWLMNDGERFMDSALVPCRMPGYDLKYSPAADGKLIRYVRYIDRDELFRDLVNKLLKYGN